MSSVIASACSRSLAVPPGRLRDEQLVADLVPPLPVLGGVDRVGRRAGDEFRRDLAGQLERRLPAERHDHPVRPLGGEHVEHVLLRQRLEVQPVGRVVVGRHRLGIAVDHHRLEAGLAQRERRVHAAVVELDALADAVRTGTEDHDLLAVAVADLGLVLVGRVVVRRLGGELGGARVDRLVGRDHAGRLAGGADVGLVGAPQVGELRIGEAEPLGAPPGLACVIVDGPLFGERMALLDDHRDLVEEPRVDLGGRVDGVDAEHRGAAVRRPGTAGRAWRCRRRPRDPRRRSSPCGPRPDRSSSRRGPARASAAPSAGSPGTCGRSP